MRYCLFFTQPSLFIFDDKNHNAQIINFDGTIYDNYEPGLRNKVIKDVAKEGNFGMIIDVAADNSVVYFDPKLDKSNVVLRKLGYSVKKKEE